MSRWESIVGQSHVVVTPDPEYPWMLPGERIIRLEARTVSGMRVGLNYVLSVHDAPYYPAVLDKMTKQLEKAGPLL